MTIALGRVPKEENDLFDTMDDWLRRDRAYPNPIFLLHRYRSEQNSRAFGRLSHVAPVLPPLALATLLSDTRRFFHCRRCQNRGEMPPLSP